MVVAGLAECIGKENVGVRFAQLFSSTDEVRTYLEMVEDDPHTTYIEAIKVLEDAGIAYLWTGIMHHGCRNHSVAQFLVPSAGLIIYAGRYTAQSGGHLLDSGLADLVAFGRTFMANPDLPARIANDWPLNPLNSATVYGGNAEGYTDYSVYGG